MIFSGRVSFALTALLSFIAISPAYATGEEGAPSFITEWPLFQRWDAMTGEIPEFDCPGVDDVTLGKWVNSEKKLSWLCYTTKTESQLAPVVSTFVEKATLSYPSEDGEEKTETVVVKRSRSELRPVLYGAKLQSSLDHPNILPILHYVVGESVKNWGVAIMPYVEGGSLESNYAKFSDQGAVNTAFKQMLSAVAAVSAAGIIHRDLKPENFLVDGDNLKLMDFDQARQIETTAQMDVGTSSYQAPGMSCESLGPTKSNNSSRNSYGCRLHYQSRHLLSRNELSSHVCA